MLLLPPIPVSQSGSEWLWSCGMTIVAYIEKEISNIIMVDSVACMGLFNK